MYIFVPLTTGSLALFLIVISPELIMISSYIFSVYIYMFIIFVHIIIFQILILCFRYDRERKNQMNATMINNGKQLKN